MLDAATSNSVAEALNGARGDSVGGVRFVEQAALPENEPYESFIFRTARVPTRDNLHDLFNGLMWLSYPQTKRRLNVLQAEQLAVLGNASTRGPLRDALTVFDENAAILRAPASLIEALRQRNWNALFLDLRAQWVSAELVIFGHALMEKLMQPRKAITAHVCIVDEITDESLAASLDPDRLAAKDFLPLPVLGVPGWWPANESPGFYDDVDVFRPPSR
ncbi:MAG TPA: DUF3025 domain-containing protein [Steroidobacter sp.]|uniref:DUF3025 domain-containing protein n=1 Tax=Steroidobacter sp. TaxID=1978227 RepID=UPI002ED82DBF